MVINKNFTYIDLFAGIGGFHCAMDVVSDGKAKCIYASEIDAAARKVYEDNFGIKPLGDIRQIDPSKYPSPDVVCGGFPCQTFSKAGKQNGFKDPRGTLFREIIRIIEYYKPEDRPKILLLENVRNLIGHDGGETWKTIKHEIELVGYNIVDEPLVITHPSAEGTAFVFRAYNGPDYTQPDFFASVLAQKLYSTVMFNVVRAKYGVCYSVFSDSDAPNSDLLLDIFYRCSDVSKLKAALAESQKIISEGKYIKSTNPDGTYIFVPISEVLEGIKNQYITSSYASQNSTYGLLNRMKSSVYRYGNPTEINKNIEKINAVTEEEIIKAFNKYMLTDKDCYIAVTGPKLESKVYNYLNAN